MAKKIASLFFLVWFSAGFAQISFAAVYKVELLVFSQSMPNTEVLVQTTTQLKWPERWLEIATPAVANQNSVVIAPLAGLSNAYNQLAHHSNYSILLQTAWMQPIEVNQAAPTIHFTDVANTLNGFITIKSGAALEVQIDAEYTQQADSASYTGNIELRKRVYRINEQRIVPLNEAHYFDHPNFGIIALITPVTP